MTTRARAILSCGFFVAILFSSAARPQAPASPGSEVTSAPIDTSDQGATPPPSTGETPGTAVEPGKIQSPDVSVSAIGNVDGPTVGLLDEDSGGLGHDMWSGASRLNLEDELTRIPIVSADPVVRDLARRILLSRADTPLGPSHHALITIRLRRLLEGGLLEEAGNLAVQVDLPNDPEFAEVQAQAFLYAGHSQDICGDKTRRRLQSAEEFWLELRTYCYVAQGNADAADLTRSILSATASADTGFPILIAELENHSPSPPGILMHPTPVDIFLLQQLGLPITPQIASQLGTAAAMLAVRDSRNRPLERLSAAEHIARTGALASRELEILANAQSFTVEQRANIRERAGGIPFLTRQVLFRQSIALEPSATMKLALIRRADPALNEQGPFAVFAALEANNVAVIPPNNSSNEASWLVARVLMLGGRSGRADAWLGPANNPLIAEAGLALDLLAPGPAHDSLAQTDLIWLATHATTDTGGWPAATALGVGLWSALGHALPPEAIQKAPIPIQTLDGETITQEQVAKIGEAVADHARRGEALLRLLNVIGGRSPTRFAPEASTFLVGTLERLGLDLNARDLAAECLLLGPPLPSARPESHVPQPGVVSSP